jgi:hypothetical protein
MNPIKINYIINAGLALAFVMNCATGLMKFSWFWSLTHLNYRSVNFRFLSFVHDWSGIILLFLIMTHLVLHWRWIISTIKAIFAAKG